MRCKFSRFSAYDEIDNERDMRSLLLTRDKERERKRKREREKERERERNVKIYVDLRLRRIEKFVVEER